MPEFDPPLNNDSQVRREALNRDIVFASGSRICHRFLSATDWQVIRGTRA
jgi:hypothetical protein